MSALQDMHAIGYCRVSLDPEDKGQTVETQKRQINDWAQRYGVHIDAILSDEGKSGGLWPRPGLSMAIMQLVNSTASILVCYDQSRLTRDAPAHLPQIKKLLQGKVIRYVVDGDADPDNLGVRIMSAIKGETDKEERRVLHEKTSAGMKTRQAQGKHIGRPAKFVITEDPDKLPTGKVQRKDNTLTDKGRIPRGTVIRSRTEVLNWARLGWSAHKVTTDHLVPVSTSSFIRAMKDAGIYEQYREILEGQNVSNSR